MCRTSRKFRVRIQRDDKTHLAQDRQVADLHWKAVEVPTEKLIQVQQLASFTLPAHPALFTRVVYTMPMKMKESSGAFGRLPLIQVDDQLRTQLHEFVVFWSRIGRIRQIRHDRVMNIRIVVPQIANLQLFNQMANLLFIQQQRRNGDQCDAVGRYSFREIHLWQRCRTQQVRREIVHQLNCCLRTRQQEDKHRERSEERRV